MITFKELLKGYLISDIPINHQHNMETLLKSINIVRTEYGKPMIVTNCYRSMQHHLDIYYNKGITDKSKIPLKSNHLTGRAVDIADPTGSLYAWCKSNTEVLERSGLWCEEGTIGWVHFQIVPPASGNRWFNP